MTGPRQEHFRMFALYNRWANDRLLDAVAKLPPEEIARERGAFFGSILGTLNHLLVADRMWMSRLEGVSPRGARLDEILFTDLPALAQARAVENTRIVAHVFALAEADFPAPLTYATTAGTEITQPLQHILAHLFNHQTHHRGQVHDMLSQAGGRDAAPVLDLVAYQRSAMRADSP